MQIFLRNANRGRGNCEPAISNMNFIFGVIRGSTENSRHWRAGGGEPNFRFWNPSQSRALFHALLVSLVWCALFGPCQGTRRKINFTLLAPEVPPEDEEKLSEILPTVKIGLEYVSNPKTGKLPSDLYDIGFNYHDTNGSAATGPLAAFDLKDQTGKSS